MLARYRQLRGGAAIAAVAFTGALGAGCAVSTQQEVQMGAQQASQVNQQLPIVNDAQLNNYINSLGYALASRGERRDIPWHFYIVNSNVVNAMSLPGGYVYVNRGVIANAGSASELAGVLAHEIGHVEHRDQIAQLERVQGANMGLTLAYVLLGRQPSAVEQAGIQVGGAAVFARYGRGMETSADEASVQLTTRAGYNPEGLVTFFQRLIAMRRTSPSTVSQWFATHPTEEQRVQTTQGYINQTVPRATLRRLTNNTSSFNSFKARMARYPAAPRQYQSR